MNVLLLAALTLQAQDWKRIEVEGLPYSFEIPEGARTRESTVRTEEGGYARHMEVTLEPGRGWDRAIRIWYSANFGKPDTIRESLDSYGKEKLWGDVESGKWRKHDTLEAGYKDFAQSGDRHIRYWIELARREFLGVTLRCDEDSFKRYAPIYGRIKNSLQPLKPGK